MMPEDTVKLLLEWVDLVRKGKKVIPAILFVDGRLFFVNVMKSIFFIFISRGTS